MQDRLFDDDEAPRANRPPSPAPGGKRSAGGDARVRPVEPDAALADLGRKLDARVHLGTSSWYFPGWAGLVWDGDHAESTLSRHGLPAYAQHPLMRTVSLDRAFYKPLTVSQYAAYAAQVPEGFRFVVKAPALVADATVRGEDGRGVQPNPAFLDPGLAVSQFVEPATQGLGGKLGVLVFQISPLPPQWRSRIDDVLERLRTMLLALPDVTARAPGALVAVEVRDPEFLTPAFVAVLREAGAAYCLGLHAKMPPIEEQLPLLRALWPGPLVCRWNLHRKHGRYGYEQAKAGYEPFDKLVDVDLETRATLAKVAAATAAAGFPVYITVNNKAEGCAPLTVAAVAQEIGQRMNAG